MKKGQNLIVKLTGILMAASVICCMSGCEKEPYYMIVEENDQYVLHQDTKGDSLYDCGFAASSKMTKKVVYRKTPPEHSYDIKCSVCFPEQ